MNYVRDSKLLKPMMEQEKVYSIVLDNGSHSLLPLLCGLLFSSICPCILGRLFYYLIVMQNKNTITVTVDVAHIVHR